VRKAAGALGFVVVVLLMMTAAFTFLAPHFGWRVDVVLSGSMEPNIHTGAVVITWPAPVTSIVPGDIITFYAPGTDKMTTHRVTAVSPGSSPSFITKGDANKVADTVPVAASSVVGRVCLNVPYIGYLTRFIRTPLGLLISLCVPGLVIIATEVRNIRKAILERDIN
jgi:signal peptidase